MHPNRKALMKRTRENLQAELKGVLADLTLQQEWEDIVFALPKAKFKHISVRGSFAAAVYEYIEAQAAEEGINLQSPSSEKLFDTELPFIAEMVITIQYLENHILDGKDGVNPQKGLDWQAIKNKLLASHFLKDFLYGYVRNRVFPQPCRERDILLECLRRMFQFTEEGQFAEKRWSSLENVQNGIQGLPSWSSELEQYIDYKLINQLWGYFHEYGMDANRESFARFYLKRMYCTNALFFALLATCVMDLAGYTGMQRENLKRFAAGFGMISQMLNDISDYVPASFGQAAVAKTPEDAYSDLRNHNFTLPLLFAANDLNVVDHLLAQNLYAQKAQHKLLGWVKPVCRNSAIPMLQAFAKEIEKHLDGGDSKTNVQLSDFTCVIYHRRYLSPFE